jgi:nitrate/TMAO reductase-like tetraheme cytochrome c subunit
MSRRRRSRTTLLGLVAIGSVALGAMSWTASDRLERENEFCLGCHLTPEVRLHDAIGRDFEHRPPASLAALHAHAGSRDAEKDGFRCVDCHGGTSWAGRVRVKLLAANDAFWYATGRFDEPDEMAWPLWDEDCRKCHASFDLTRSEDFGSMRFHELVGHNDNLGVACVECHRVHDTGVDPESSYLHASHVKTQCARCHEEFREDG